MKACQKGRKQVKKKKQVKIVTYYFKMKIMKKMIENTHTGVPG